MTFLKVFEDKDLKIDLPKYIDSRGLICANSGAGKSYAIRKILEEANEKVMCIVLDVEGEFKTLREKFDFLLIGHDGDVPINIKSADLLPKKLLELNVSSIIDISELKMHERILYVKKFLEALMELPREFWKPCFVVLDEAHLLCSQQEKQESFIAVIDLMTRGRKRGFCLHPNTEIITFEGLKEIKDIAIGDLVLTHKGRFKKVIAKSVRDYKGEMIKMRTFGSFSETITTPNHSYLIHSVKNSHGVTILDDMVWKPAEEIRSNSKRKDRHISHRTFSPSILEDFDLENLSLKYKKRKRIRQTKVKKQGEGYKTISLPLNSDLLKIIGYFLAEGSYIKRKHQVEKNLCGLQFAFGNSEKELSYVLELSNSLSNLGYKPEVKKLKTGNYYLRIRVRELAELFKNYFWEYSWGKKIPMELLLLPKEKLKILFEAYINGDGYIRKNCISVATVSRNLAFAISLIGQKLGYSSSIQFIKRKKGYLKNRPINQRDIYRVYFKQLKKGCKNKIINDNYLCRSIKGKDYIKYSGKVYNLQVEEDESYCSSSHVLHNCGILCSQRIAKLHKDAVAEANNILIGRTGLDIDMKRAAEILGFTSKQDMLSLRDLEPGEFYVFGPAISKSVTKAKVGKVITTHPKVGMSLKTELSKPTERIKNLLTKLSDLPKEAEEELKTKQNMQRKIRELEKQLRTGKVDEKSEERIRQNMQAGFSQEIKKLELGYNLKFKEAEKSYAGQFNGIKADISRFSKGIQQITSICSNLLQIKTPLSSPEHIKFESHIKPIVIPQVKPNIRVPKLPINSGAEISGDLGICAKKIYSFLFYNQDRAFTKSQIGAVTGYSSTSGGFNNALSQLNSLGLIIKDGGLIKVNEMRSDLAEEFNFSIEAIIPTLGKCEKEIYEVLLANPGQEYSREELASSTPTNYSPTSGGFNNSLSRLNTLGLIIKKSNSIKLNPELLEI